MKVLWFEVTEPSNYRNEGSVLGGWQDSLEAIVRNNKDIELHIAFKVENSSEIRIVNGVTYHPIEYNVNFFNKFKSLYTCKVISKSLLIGAIKVINDVKPDIIHVFGLEWAWGLVAEFTNVPIVLHIMGSIIPYNNAFFPPGYNSSTVYRALFPNIKKIVGFYIQQVYYKSLIKQEKRVWNCVHNYMGRTIWDERLTTIQSKGSHYWHVDEAIRSTFLMSNKVWNNGSEIQLLSIGCSSFWKGPDMLLKTAKILKHNGLKFQWMVAGSMNYYVKRSVEYSEKTTFEDNNVKILGFVKPDQLVSLIYNSTLYVHTAYIENSPNSICEAQCLGLPIVATNVGGIPSLIRNGIDGELVPANDPYQMAACIIKLVNNKEQLSVYSANSREAALKRHNPNNIMCQLMDCYKDVLIRDCREM